VLHYAVLRVELLTLIHDGQPLSINGKISLANQGTQQE
jgi:hypothetical protein